MEPGLSRRLLRLFALAVLGRWDELAQARRAAPPGEPDRAWREVALQVHVFAGFPRAVEAYSVLERAGGLGTPDLGEVLAEPDQPERGRALFERIYAGQSGAIRAALERGHPDFARFIEGHAYGRILARPGLEPTFREQLAVAALAALGQERQLASHARGCLRLGGSESDVHAALDAVADLIAPERLARARSVLERLKSAADQ
jgi:alkylhydroperoxidase/carboxymuconolactone decarboxylase family protein YurZ